VLSTVAWVVETATRVVDACYQAGGGSALYEKSPLQRRLRDIHTLTQHASVQENIFMTLGAQKLGRAGSFSV
jgi:alkylation response protein AidB-like acyl-CoA dehydrogenase